MFSITTRIRRDERRHHGEGGGRRVAGNVQHLCLQLMATFEGDVADAILFAHGNLRTEEASMRSVWSRVGTGSITVVAPGVFNPASSTADFTCADATGSV